MTEPTTEELERVPAPLTIVIKWFKALPKSARGGLSLMNLHDLSKQFDAAQAQRLSDLEGKLGEARKALTEIASEDFGGPVGISIYAAAANELSRRQKLASEALKLTASGGGEDNSLSQGAKDAHPSVRPETQHSAGDEN